MYHWVQTEELGLWTLRLYTGWYSFYENIYPCTHSAKSMSGASLVNLRPLLSFLTFHVSLKWPHCTFSVTSPFKNSFFFLFFSFWQNEIFHLQSREFFLLQFFRSVCACASVCAHIRVSVYTLWWWGLRLLSGIILYYFYALFIEEGVSQSKPELAYIATLSSHLALRLSFLWSLEL